MTAAIFPRVLSAAVVVTDDVTGFPDRLTAELPGHYLLVHNHERATITINTVRSLQSALSFRMGSNEHQEIVLLYADFITLPAQHALLKILEEPPARTRFWLVTTSPSALLETVRSRCLTLTETSANANETPNQSATFPNRLQPEMLEQFATATATSLSELAGQAKDRGQALSWCVTLLQQLQPRLAAASPAEQDAARVLLTAVERLKANGNVRLILEDCFFTIRLAYQPRV